MSHAWLMNEHVVWGNHVIWGNFEYKKGSSPAPNYMPANRFINAINHFLTYPQCPITKEDAMAAILTKDAAAPSAVKISWIVVGHELHEDGGDHLHVAIGYARKRDISNATYYDLSGPFDANGSSKTYHPNIQASRNKIDVIKYVKKDGDFCEHGAVPNTETAASIDWAEVFTYM